MGALIILLFCYGFVVGSLGYIIGYSDGRKDRKKGKHS
jgi:hypothetical protein